MNRMGACFDRLRCEVFQNLFLSPMNTGFLGSAVATVLTVYGIETMDERRTVHIIFLCSVATVLTVYGIETTENKAATFFFCRVATVLTVYGIET